jgi:hypothetical protein
MRRMCSATRPGRPTPSGSITSPSRPRQKRSTPLFARQVHRLFIGWSVAVSCQDRLCCRACFPPLFLGVAPMGLSPFCPCVWRSRWVSVASPRQYMPYDIELLPPVTKDGATRSAYLRLAKEKTYSVCKGTMSNYAMQEQQLYVRAAFQKVFPVVVRKCADPLGLGEGLPVKPLDVDSIPGPGGDVVMRFAKADDARRAVTAINGRGAGQARLGWRDFRVSLAGLPGDLTEQGLRDLVQLTSPYEAVVEGGGRGAVAFLTKAEAEMAVSQLSGTGLDLRMRKVRG